MFDVGCQIFRSKLSSLVIVSNLDLNLTIHAQIFSSGLHFHGTVTALV